ncbi:hypothetical protein KEM54_005442 [Ascosphaera aggregata]|nr:hypothetical protein KEM54_005442 [Ascosphaera aggregata]
MLSKLVGVNYGGGDSLDRPELMKDNLGIDYVLVFNYGKAEDTTQAVKQFEHLIRSLSAVGMETEVRPNDEEKLFIFIRAREEALRKTLHRIRVRDWLHGVRQVQPPNDENAGKPEREAERLQAIFNMLVFGADIFPESEEFSLLEMMFPLHHKELNLEWIKSWSSKTFLTAQDLDDIRSVHGEHVAFYFAFLQFYFGFLTIPAAVGFFCWLFIPGFSIIYGIANSISCMVYVEMWKRRQGDLNIRWLTQGVSEIRMKRKAFKPEGIIEDELTHEKILYFPVWKRVCRQLLQVPLAIASIVSLGTIIAVCFAIEILLDEVYDGPLKQYFTLIPTILVSALVPTLTGILTGFAHKLNDFENYETVDAYTAAMVHKHFLIDFITNFLPILLTAFVYMPLGSVIIPHLDLLGTYTIKTFVNESDSTELTPMKEFRINSSRLRDQVIYFAITAQVVDGITEIGVPYIKRKLLQKYRDYCERRAELKEEQKEGVSDPQANPTRQVIADRPEEAAFLKRVREEVTLEQYDIAADFQELAVQFGHMSLFSVVWPVVPLAFLCNNWVELRSDFVKICMECRRPIPMRSEGIGSWLDSLEFLAWLGSITSAAMVYMFRSNGDYVGDLSSQITGWTLLLCIIFAEHAYLLLRWVVQTIITNIDTPTRKKFKASKYLLRKQLMDRMAAHSTDWEQPDAPNIAHVAMPKFTDSEKSEVAKKHPVSAGEPVSAETLMEAQKLDSKETVEADARDVSRTCASLAETFWEHQKGWQECVKAGEAIITDGPLMAAVEGEPKKDK